jgi:hypothetical protein
MIPTKASQFGGRTCFFLLATWGLASCSRAPSVDVLGSFFPAWLLCLTIAVALTAFVQLLLSRLRMRVAYPILFFPSLATLLTLALWLIFFH